MYSAHIFTLVLSNLTTVGSGPPVTVYSPLDCARLCLDKDECSSFFYNADTEACISSSERHLDSTGLTGAEGYMYFIMRQDCGEAWTVRRGQCYQYVDERKSAKNAQAECERRGGFLAKTDSDADNAAIKMFLTDKRVFWIGGMDEAENGNWSWRDGSRVIPNYWESGKPDNQEEEFCMEQKRYGWNDRRCNSRLTFLCEK